MALLKVLRCLWISTGHVLTGTNRTSMNPTGPNTQNIKEFCTGFNASFILVLVMETLARVNDPCGRGLTPLNELNLVLI